MRSLISCLFLWSCALGTSQAFPKTNSTLSRRKEAPLAAPKYTIIDLTPAVDGSKTVGKPAPFKVPVFKAKDLAAWTKGMKSMKGGVKVIPEDVNPEGMFTSQWPNTEEQYVLVGVHHAGIVNRRGYTLNKVLASFEAESIRIRDETEGSDMLLYGKGAYLTQRPAIGTAAAAISSCFDLYKLEMHYEDAEERWRGGVLALNVFLPVAQVAKWMRYDVPLVRDGIIEDDKGVRVKTPSRPVRDALQKLRGKPRKDWGLYDDTVLLARNDAKKQIEEIVLWSSYKGKARFVGEMVDRKTLAEYCEYANGEEVERFVDSSQRKNDRKVRHNKLIPKIEATIPDTETWKLLKKAAFDLHRLPMQKSIPSEKEVVWDGFKTGDARDY